ncbi:MAG: membrane protein insertion efficiency factor YidD [Chloroflexi bacterium]|nr:membrane protein insertion efficiency factor YidD [Chloroflexota bacterium]
MLRKLSLKLIKAYQRTISQATPPSCRFVPSCSQYGYEAIERFGFLKGVWLTMKRIARCNPFSAGGVDPVP